MLIAATCVMLAANNYIPTGRIVSRESLTDKIVRRDITQKIIKDNRIFEQNLRWTVTKCCKQDGLSEKDWKSEDKKWRKHKIKASRKRRNKSIKIIKGNRKSNYKILHWNLGARYWQNKLEDIEVLLNQYKPDLCLISEANLWRGLEPDKMEIGGHTLIFPKTMQTQDHARIILIVTKLEELMDDSMASIWVRIGNPGKNSIKIGGVYREHLILGENNTEMTRQEHKFRQEQRWRMSLKRWKTASMKQNCVVIGDFNLDHIKWDSPETHHEIMVQDMKWVVSRGSGEVGLGHSSKGGGGP